MLGIQSAKGFSVVGRFDRTSFISFFEFNADAYVVLTIWHQKFSRGLLQDMAKRWIGGVWAVFSLTWWPAILPSSTPTLTLHSFTFSHDLAHLVPSADSAFEVFDNIANWEVLLPDIIEQHWDFFSPNFINLLLKYAFSFSNPSLSV